MTFATTKDPKAYRDDLAEQLTKIGYEAAKARDLADRVAIAVLNAKTAIKDAAFAGEVSRRRAALVMHLSMMQLAENHKTFGALGDMQLLIAANDPNL